MVRAIVVALVFLYMISSAPAQVVFDANSTAAVGSTSSVPNLANSNLTIGSGSNRALIAQVAINSRTITSSSCVWDTVGANQSMTLIKRQIHGTSGLTSELWGLVNPVSGNKTLTCTFSTSVAFVSLNGISFTGVDQTGGTTSFYNATGATGSSTAASVTISSASGDATIETGLTTQTDSAPNQTLVYDVNSTFGGYGQRAAGAASVTFSWTISPSSPWVEAASSIKAAAIAATDHNLSLIGVGH